MIRAILFDKDGTFTHFHATWDGWMGATLRDLAAASGADVGTLADGVGYDLDAGRMRPAGTFVTATTRTSVDALARLTGWDAATMASWWLPRLNANPHVAVPGVAPMVDALRGQGLRVGVLTNADRAQAEAGLGEIGVLDRLDGIVACDDGHGAKPDPAGALAFAASVGVDPAAILVVGDGATDRDAAAAAGMPFAAVLTGTLGADAFPDAVVVLDVVTDLPDWLAASANPD